MSNAQYYLREARRGYAVGNGILLDPNTESQPRSQPADQYGVLTMGMTAENIAEKYVISRTAQDYFACESQEKAQAAIKSGRFDDEIEPLPVKKKKEILMFAADEHPRLSTIEKLAELKPAFKKDGSVTAGNASGRNDGGAMLLIAEESAAAKAGLKPMAKISSQASIAVSPAYMGMGPVPATRLALKRAGLRIEDIGLIEINEAFAAQSLAVIQELEIDLTRVNVNGGAIALGHPIGCSGARILVTLLHEMQKRQVRYGLATLCIAGVLSEDGAELSSGCFYFGYSLNICCILRRNVFNEQECSANDRILGQRVLIDVCFWDADGFSFIDRLCTGIDTFG